MAGGGLAVRGGLPQLPGPHDDHHHAGIHRSGHAHDRRAVRSAYFSFSVGVWPSESFCGISGRSLQPQPCHYWQFVRVVGSDLAYRLCHHVRAVVGHARPDGHQRGLLHSGGFSPNRGLPSGRDALVGNGHPHRRDYGGAEPGFFGRNAGRKPRLELSVPYPRHHRDWLFGGVVVHAERFPPRRQQAECRFKPSQKWALPTVSEIFSAVAHLSWC